VWFDGANGEGPNGKRQIYDWPRFFGLVRRLQPNAVMFSDAGPDVRWCGNESGTAGDPNWSPVNPNVVTFPGQDGPGINDALQHGDRAGTVWRPAEVDVSIRPGWFYHSAEDERVRTVDNLTALYLSSVGRNGKLLLNVPPTRDGVLHTTDVARLASFRARLTSMFEHDLAGGLQRKPVAIRGTAAAVEINLGKPVAISVARLEEDIARGQSVARYAIYGAANGKWHELSRGSTIGYAKLDRFGPAAVERVRLAIEDSAGPPGEITLRLYNPSTV
jgi:alpha-L-fucosidase